MSNRVKYLGQSHRGLSPRIAELAKVRDDQDAGNAAYYFNDFTEAPHVISNSVALTSVGYGKAYTDDGVVISGTDAVNNTAQVLGSIEVSGNDADNDEGQLKFGSDNWLQIDSANAGKVMFEARFKTASIANNGCSIFLGLSGWQPAANGLADNTGAFAAAEAYIGFRTLAADGDILEFVFQAASQTVNTVLDAQTLVADTWYKVGFVYDPNTVDKNKRIKIFVDNVENATGVTQTEIDAATFPEAEALSPLLLTKVGAAAEVKVELDWIFACQYCSNG